MKSLITFICFLALAIYSSSASALPITFVHTGSGSGSIDGADFSDAAFTITSMGDTDNRVDLGFGYRIGHDASLIEIDGVGTFNLITATDTFVNNSNELVGYTRDFGDLFSGPEDTAFATWDMLSSIGPISGIGSTLQWTVGEDIVTDGGVLIFESGAVDATFQATVVPEPGTWALLAIGFCWLAIMRRKQ